MSIQSFFSNRRLRTFQRQKDDLLRFLESNEGSTFEMLRIGCKLKESKLCDLIADLMLVDGLVKVKIQENPTRYYTTYGIRWNNHDADENRSTLKVLDRNTED